MAFDSSYPLWSANVMRAMGHVSVLTGLQAVQLRFICGDRGEQGCAFVCMCGFV